MNKSIFHLKKKRKFRLPSIGLSIQNKQEDWVEQVLSFNVLMSFGTSMHTCYVALITHNNSNVHFIFNYNAYKDLVWTVSYYN